jgi:hypothetical protein
MGNNLQGFNRLNKGHFPNYHEQLGNYGAIDVTKIEMEAINGHTGELFDISKWNTTYTIENSKCILDLKRVSNKDGKVNSVSFQIIDEMYSDGNIWFAIGKEASFLSSSTPPLLLNGGFKNCRQKNNKTTNTLGYVIETWAYLYGSGSKRGLLVLEEMRKSGDNKKPSKVTVAHYYADNSRNLFSQNKIDIGLSVIVRIQLSSEVGLDITVQGPVQHPSRALHSMFLDVMKTGIWKPTKFCATIDVGDDSDMQSESEDCDDFLPRRVYGLSQNVKSIIANSGAVRGNNNGNLYVNRIYLKR